MDITRSHLHAIHFAKRHGIPLVPGRKIYGDGNCAFNAAICNINDMCCYAEKFLEPVLVYRRRRVTAVQHETELHHSDLIGGLARHHICRVGHVGHVGHVCHVVHKGHVCHVGHVGQVDHVCHVGRL